MILILAVLAAIAAVLLGLNGLIGSAVAYLLLAGLFLWIALARDKGNPVP